MCFKLEFIDVDLLNFKLQLILAFYLPAMLNENIEVLFSALARMILVSNIVLMSLLKDCTNAGH